MNSNSRKREEAAAQERSASAQNADQVDAALAEGTEPTAASEIELLRKDLEEAGNRVLRAQAELENYRKRARRELDEERRFANVPLVRDLLPVMDNVQRAIAAAEKTPNAANLLDGFRMVSQAFDSALSRHHVQRIDALHQPFDPAYHEAISQQPSAEHPPNTVIMIVQDGFTLHDRVVRPAQVIVSAAPPGEPAA